MKHGGYASVSVARVMWMYKCNVNSNSGEKWKELSSSAILRNSQCKQNLFPIIEKWDIKYVQTLPASTEGALEIIGEGFHN